MAIQYSRDALNGIADGLADFSTANVAPIRDRGDTVFWMIEIGMIETLWVKFKPVFGRAYRHFLRHLYSAQKAHSEMSEALADFFQDYQPSSPKFRSYFDALSSVESFLLHMHIAHDSYKEIQSGFDFPAVDEWDSGDIFIRVSTLSNGMKHSSGRSKGQNHRSLPKHALFFVNDGVSDGKVTLSFQQMADFFEFMVSPFDEVVSEINGINPLKKVMIYRR